MFSKIDTKKGQFLEQTKAARAERAQEKEKDKCALKIQVRRHSDSDSYTMGKTMNVLPEASFCCDVNVLCDVTNSQWKGPFC